jgi:hypothetical protein
MTKTMIKNIFQVIFLLLISIAVTAQSVTLEEARKIYSESMQDKATCEDAYQKFTLVKNSGNPLLTGYKGAVSVAMSKHLKAAKEKIAHFNEGKKLIESAILEDGKNVELKFIRFTIQTNCPPALKYNKNIPEDKKYIIENLNAVKNSGVRSRIKEYLLQSKDVTTEEKQKINAL